MVYTPVISPARSWKLRLTSTGSSTFPTAIPAPAIVVPTYSGAMPGSRRMSSPAMIAPSAAPTAAW